MRPFPPPSPCCRPYAGGFRQRLCVRQVAARRLAASEGRFIKTYAVANSSVPLFLVRRVEITARRCGPARNRILFCNLQACVRPARRVLNTAPFYGRVPPATRLSKGKRAGRIDQRRRRATVLAVSLPPRHQVLLRSVLRNPGWHLDCVSSGRDALRHLWRKRVSVLICGDTLPDGTWQELFEEACFIEPRPAFFVAGDSACGWPADGAAARIAKALRREQVRLAVRAGVGSEVSLCTVCG